MSIAILSQTDATGAWNCAEGTCRKGRGRAVREAVRLLLIASDCFWLLLIASDCAVREADEHCRGGHMRKAVRKFVWKFVWKVVKVGAVVVFRALYWALYWALPWAQWWGCVGRGRAPRRRSCRAGRRRR